MLTIALKPPSFDLPEIELPDIDLDPPEYEDTLLKDLAEDIKAPQQELSGKLDVFIQESRESSARTLGVAVATLVVAVLTLAATVIFGLMK